jgi:hypothetical protein
MARLPSRRYLMQAIGDDVILFEEGTEREIMRVRLIPQGRVHTEAIGPAQKAIHDATELSAEDRSMAHFWLGYFYACAGGNG